MGIFAFVKSLFSDDNEQDEQAAVLERMAADREDPRKAFVFAVLCCTEDRDPGYLPDYAKEAVTNWYGVESAQEFKTPARLFERFSKSCTLPPGIRTNEPFFRVDPLALDQQAHGAHRAPIRYEHSSPQSISISNSAWRDAPESR